MKVIDLLNKIANGEEVPKKIKLNEIIFEYQGDDYLFIDKDNTNYWLFSEPYSDKFEYLENFLKSEVEIIEEEKKIPEKLKDILRIDDLIPTVDENMYRIWKQVIKNYNKLNEICDYLESKGE